MSVFHFKQFSVIQKNSSHKVGTDGVLLGAWTNYILPHNFLQILDIGSGTGVISLMMAQAYHNAQITAIDNDIDSTIEAANNFNNSPWEKRLHIHNCALSAFIPKSKFQLIISNPPFYKEHTISPDRRRAAARHIHSLTPDQIFSFAATNLADNGYLCMILPYYHYEDIQNLSSMYALHWAYECKVRPKVSKTPNRILLCLTLQEIIPKYSQLTIYEEDNVYTSEYIEICKNYYLNM